MGLSGALVLYCTRLGLLQQVEPKCSARHCSFKTQVQEAVQEAVLVQQYEKMILMAVLDADDIQLRQIAYKQQTYRRVNM